jgi:hypothetical protein
VRGKPIALLPAASSIARRHEPDCGHREHSADTSAKNQVKDLMSRADVFVLHRSTWRYGPH